MQLLAGGVMFEMLLEERWLSIPHESWQDKMNTQLRHAYADFRSLTGRTRTKKAETARATANWRFWRAHTVVDEFKPCMGVPEHTSKLFKTANDP
eukprot:3365262-Alexandrium_andersonii.AAC.1